MVRWITVRSLLNRLDKGDDEVGHGGRDESIQDRKIPEEIELAGYWAGDGEGNNYGSNEGDIRGEPRRPGKKAGKARQKRDLADKECKQGGAPGDEHVGKEIVEHTSKEVAEGDAGRPVEEGPVAHEHKETSEGVGKRKCGEKGG